MKRIRSGSAFEVDYGYCRVVVAGGFAFVAGTVAAGPDVPEDVVDQCKSALATIEKFLGEAGSSLAKAVRVTYYVQDLQDFLRCKTLLAETFGDNPPAASMVECRLIDPKYKVEIEVTAVV